MEFAGLVQRFVNEVNASRKTMHVKAKKTNDLLEAILKELQGTPGNELPGAIAKLTKKVPEASENFVDDRAAAANRVAVLLDGDKGFEETIGLIEEVFYSFRELKQKLQQMKNGVLGLRREASKMKKLRDSAMSRVAQVGGNGRDMFLLIPDEMLDMIMQYVGNPGVGVVCKRFAASWKRTAKIRPLLRFNPAATPIFVKCSSIPKRLRVIFISSDGFVSCVTDNGHRFSVNEYRVLNSENRSIFITSETSVIDRVIVGRDLICLRKISRTAGHGRCVHIVLDFATKKIRKMDPHFVAIDDTDRLVFYNDPSVSAAPEIYSLRICDKSTVFGGTMAPETTTESLVQWINGSPVELWSKVEVDAAEGVLSVKLHGRYGQYFVQFCSRTGKRLFPVDKKRIVSIDKEVVPVSIKGGTMLKGPYSMEYVANGEELTSYDIGHQHNKKMDPKVCAVHKNGDVIFRSLKTPYVHA